MGKKFKIGFEQLHKDGKKYHIRTVRLGCFTTITYKSIRVNGELIPHSSKIKVNNKGNRNK